MHATPLEASPPGGDQLWTGLAGGGDLRWAAVDLTASLEEIRLRLGLSPIATVALGRTLAGTVLVHSVLLRQPRRITVEIRGDGPLGKVVAEFREDGRLRGLVGNPNVPHEEGAALEIAPAIGRGTLRVSREDPQRNYSSEVELVSGELGEDLTHFLKQSEQIRSAVLLGVLLKPEGVEAAGGFVVEALPGTGEERVAQIEGNISRREGISSVLDRGGIGALVELVLGGLGVEPQERTPVGFHCGCTREGLLQQLQPVATDDLDSLLGSGGACEAVCAFCGERYLFAASELAPTN